MDKREKLGMKISMGGSVLLSLSAIIMAVITGSQAILFDGVYTIVTFIMALISLKVIDLVNNPESNDRPFGFMALEPFFNLIKCSIILVFLVIFLVTNVQELCRGGKKIPLNAATIYILISLVIYFLVIYLFKKYTRGSSSSILHLEIKNWWIDTFIDLGIAVSFIAAIIIIQMGYVQILPYIDPVVVILLVLVSLPIPLKIFFLETKRLLLISNENNLDAEVIKQIQPVISKYGLRNVKVWALKSGRTNYFFLYLDQTEESVSITYLDEIRKAIFHELAKSYPKFWADIIFTRINPDEPFPFAEKEKASDFIFSEK